MADVDHVETDAFTFTDSGGGASVTPSDQTARDVFRVSERELVQDTATLPLLARPLYALIESNPRTAAVIDYAETVAPSEWRETGLEVNL